MNICDKAGKNNEDAKKYLRAITRRLYNTDPHIAIQGVVVSLTFISRYNLTRLFLIS